jgi:2-keto-4-pentenoate hydratase/2-oxohepta-3-ene-1,7-dioic acid hydratase in catechol pathway
MKLVLFNDHRPGLLRDDGVVDISGAVQGVAGRNGQETMQGIIAGFDALKPALQRALEGPAVVPLNTVRLRAPLPRPGKIMMMGANFLEHTPGPPLPIFGFFKSPEAILETGGTITLPEEPFVICHHEAEPVVVIGRGGHKISEAAAPDAVFGYMVGCDVSARFYPDLPNTLLGKSFNGFAPIGPAIVTRDEVPDLYALQVRLWVDGTLRQDFPVSDMGHHVPACIRYWSSRTTLNPGDIMFMGTNHQGLGPLQDGNRVEMELTGLGSPRLTFSISDPLKRSWPVGVDTDPGQRVRGNLLKHQAELAAKR